MSYSVVEGSSEVTVILEGVLVELQRSVHRLCEGCANERGKFRGELFDMKPSGGGVSYDKATMESPGG